MNLRYWGGFILSAAMVFGLFTAALRSPVSYIPADASLETARVRLIIDPGHGGEDGGALSCTGKKESEINLEISLRCEALAAFLGDNAVMTRRSEELSYPDTAHTTRARKVADQKGRVALVNSYPGALLVSIHQNKYTSASPSGAQVFWANGGEEAATGLQELFIKYINPDNKRAAKKVSEDIYLMKNVTCPALLVECGFVSNPGEAAKLESPEHQKKLAVLIAGECEKFINQRMIYE